MMIINKQNHKRGFTLVEALVGVSIFSISVVTLLTVLGSGISDTNTAKRKVTASYLALEGIEFMRNMRDTYMLYNTGTGWSSFQARLQSASCDFASGCFYNDTNLDYSDQSQPITDSSLVPLTACSGSQCTNGPLSYNSSNGKYGIGSGGSWTASGFTRKINAAVLSANEIKITSTVTWTKGSRTFTSTLSENLFNWTD
jgi:type II secretory pathway pseudopilin PulG